MNSDIRLMLSFRNHPKTKKLRFKLGSDGALSFIWLLMFAAESKTDGVLDGMDETDIALAADWNGDHQEFVQTLFAIGFLDRDGDTYRIHDWADNNPWAAKSKERSEHARKAAEAKWARRQAGTKKQQVTPENDAPSRNGDAQGNAPSPIPSPNPIPKPKERARKTRLHSDWEPSEKLINYCREKRPDLDPATTFENAKDYYLSHGKTMADWDRAMMRWVRNERTTQPGTSQQAPRETAVERADRKAREAADALGITL